MAVNTAQNHSMFIEELNGKLTRIYDEQAKRSVDQSVGMKIFDVQEDKNYASSYAMVGTIGWPKKVAEGENLPETVAEVGYKKIVTQNHYGDSFKVTKDHRLFIANHWKQIANYPKNMVRTAFNYIDQSMADVLNNGWATSYTDVYGQTVDGTTPDNVALFSNAHKVSPNSKPFSNIIVEGAVVNPALTRSALVAAKVMASRATDSNGVLSPIQIDTLLVSPEDEDQARIIVESKQRSGTNNNDINPQETVGGIKVMVWNRLKAGQWFIYDSSMIGETFAAGFAQKPQLSKPTEYPQNLNWIYTMDYYYYIQLGYAGYIYGSKGTNAA